MARQNGINSVLTCDYNNNVTCNRSGNGNDDKVRATQMRWQVLSYHTVSVAILLIFANQLITVDCLNSFNHSSPLAHPINQFSLKYLRSVQNLSDNVFFSPLSISMMYSMLLRGAGGLTAQQIISTFEYDLNFTGQQDIHEAFKELVFDYKMIEIKSWQRNFTLKIGNLILVDKHFPILAEYADHLLNEYHASVAEEDFSYNGRSVMERVNQWIRAKTNNRINRLFDHSFDYRTKLLLINAIYFEGNWLIPFQRPATSVRSFYNIDGSRSDVKMMYNIGTYKYAELWDLNMKILELPFEGDIAMYIILPNERTDLNPLMSSLTSSRLEEIVRLMDRQVVEVQFPKFRLEGRYNLNKILFNMGLFLPFITNTDFFGISKQENLRVTDSMHTAIIQISEEGLQSETKSGFAFPLLRRSGGPRFVVEHPFGFFIRDNNNQINLFLGTINKL
ncbi:iripin-8-like [Brevipalpus obovatus]|uniref:iripin-8-like n=1 Tax=Brevipalpus obovatus TaxID=246614 RepID=UPI003D9DEC98